jgi:undecaprenyl-phosphate galactose phosphotransferase
MSVFVALIFANLMLAVFFSQFFISDAQNHLISNYYWIGAVYLLVYYSYRLMTRRMVTTNEFMVILKSNVLALIVIFFFVAATKMGDGFSRTILILHFLLNGLIPVWSYLIKKYAFKFAFLRRPVFAICDSEGEKNIKNWFDKGNPFGYDVEVVLNIDTMDILQIHRALDKLILNDAYDSAIIDFDSSNIFELSDLVDHIQKNIHKVIILPKISKMPMLNGELISSIHHKGMAFYVKNNLLSPVDRVLKNVFDFVLASCLALLFSPVLLLLYGLVFISTKGHPLFTHQRIGRGGKKFMVYKFRTMHLDADERLELILQTSHEALSEWESDFKLKNDPRITKIGKFLRKTSLDELPQLINVLKGEMSLVGPRPIVEEEVKKYGEYFEYFTAVNPGITGLWQVSGRNDIDYDERVQLDVWYVRNWSIELDIEILIKTIMVVIGRKGSY